MSEPSPEITSPPFRDPRMLPFLPMLYVAWADGELSDAEAKEICARLGGKDGESGGCRQVFGRWLDPRHRPSAAEMRRMLTTIRDGAGEAAVDDKLSLVELGLLLARAGDQHVSEEERQALVEIEEVLEVASTEAARQLLTTRRPAAPVEISRPSFDVAAMTRLLDGPDGDIHARVRAFLSRPEMAYEYGVDKETYRERVLTWCRELAAEGFGALAFPESYGGEGDIGRFVTAFEALAFGDLSLVIKFGVQFGLFGGSIHQLGTEKHHEKYLRQVGTLELPGCFAMTETGHGSNVYDIETVARYDVESGEFDIHTPHPGARKEYIGNAAAHGQMATVFAQLEIGGVDGVSEDFGVHAFLVPIRDAAGRPCAGVRIEDCGEKLGLNGVDNGRLYFDHVRIPAENLLDRFAQVSADGSYHSPIPSPSKRFFTMLGTLIGGRVSIAAAGMSVAKSALAIAVRYGARRRQFGPPGEPETVLLDYLTHQRRLMPRLATTYALDFALADLTRQYATAPAGDRRELEAQAAGLKAYSTWHATDTVQTCREACGGQGYLAINRFAALKADSDIFTTFEGDNTVLMQLVAKSLLTGYKKQFSEMNLFGLVRFVGRQATANLADLNPIITRRADEEHLRDLDFQLGALRFREDKLVSTVARRLKRRIDAKMDPARALVECQDHLVSAARAHVERRVLEHFAEAIEACDDAGLRQPLETLRSLYALWRIEQDRGWFLEQGYLEGVKAKAIRTLVNALCGEAREQAVALVDAFGIPESALGAPIAR